MRDASATSPGQGAVCDARSGVPSGPMGTSTSASSDHHVGAHAAAAATCPKLQRPNVQAIPAAFSMGPAVAAASTEHGHENMSMLNDVRKSDASQVVAARTDSFGRTNHTCWEQVANDAAAHVESAQTTNVFGIVGTVITTAFDDNAAPGDAADTSGTNAEGATQCAPMGLALRLRGGGDDFAAVFQDHENKLFPVSLPSGHVINNYAQFESFLWTQLSSFGAKIWQLPVTLRDGRTTTLQKLQEHMLPWAAAAEAEVRARREAAAREAAAEAEVRAQREAAAREAAAREAAAEAEMQNPTQNHKSKSQIKITPLKSQIHKFAQREAAARDATREAELTLPGWGWLTLPAPAPAAPSEPLTTERGKRGNRSAEGTARRKQKRRQFFDGLQRRLGEAAPEEAEAASEAADAADAAEEEAEVVLNSELLEERRRRQRAEKLLELTRRQKRRDVPNRCSCHSYSINPANTAVIARTAAL